MWIFLLVSVVCAQQEPTESDEVAAIADQFDDLADDFEARTNDIEEFATVSARLLDLVEATAEAGSVEAEPETELESESEAAASEASDTAVP